MIAFLRDAGGRNSLALPAIGLPGIAESLTIAAVWHNQCVATRLAPVPTRTVGEGEGYRAV